MSGEVVLNDAVTPAMRYGAGIALVLGATTLLAALGGLLRGRIARRSMTPSGGQDPAGAAPDERAGAHDAAGEGPATTTRERVG